MLTVEEAETAFADAVKEYDNQWITFIEKDGLRVIVGSGRNAVEAVADSDAKGFPDAILLKVLSLTTSFVFTTAIRVLVLYGTPNATSLHRIRMRFELS
jgi:hypothetical protein